MVNNLFGRRAMVCFLLAVAIVPFSGCSKFKSKSSSGSGGSTASTSVNITALSTSLKAAENLTSYGTLSSSGSLTGATFQVATAPAHGQLSITPATGVFTYSPTSSYSGADSFTYNIKNGSGTSNTGTVSITVVADTAPVTTAGSFVVKENSSAYAGTFTAVDAESNAIAYVIATPPSHGTAVLVDANAGTFTYTPTAGYFGSDTFSFQATDGALTSAATAIAITVTQLPYANGLSSKFQSSLSSEANSGDLNLPSTTAFTLSLWLKMAGTPVANESIYSIVDQATPRFLKLYWKDSATLEAELFDGGEVTVDTTSIVPTQWNLILFAWDTAQSGNNFRLYINGVLCASTGITGSIDFNLAAGEHVEIGHFNHANYLDGWVDDVAYWSSSLADAEVVAAYNSGHQIDYRSNYGNYVSSGTLLYNWWMGDNSTLPTINPAQGDAPLTTTGVSFVADAP